jgi:hypothetical protein
MRYGRTMHLVRRGLRVLAVFAVAALGLLTSVSPASASSPAAHQSQLQAPGVQLNPATAGKAGVASSVFAMDAVTAPSDVLAADCPTPSGPPPGQRLCDYNAVQVAWPDGHAQYFVVGTTGHIYDSWQSERGSSLWSNWRDLGGIGQSVVFIHSGEITSVVSGVTYVQNWFGDRIDLAVEGTDGGMWCKFWSRSGDWYPGVGSWYSC